MLRTWQQRWTVSRTLLAAVALLGAGWWLGQATSQAADKEAKSRFFEMRTYYTAEGRLDALNKRFREHTNKLFVKHGMELVGYWVPTDEPKSKNTLVYILAYPNKEAREASWQAFVSDPDWKTAKSASEKDGPIVTKVETMYLSPTDYSPIR